MMFSSNDPGELQVYKICMNQMQRCRYMSVLVAGKIGETD
jgi:hypothetical protein